MIITCPSCSRKYSVDDVKVGNGKKVRCTVCGTVWFYKPETIQDLSTPISASGMSSRIHLGDIAENAHSEDNSLLKKIFWIFINLITIAGLAFSSFYFRDYIVTYIPQTRLLYELAGIKCNLVNNALEIVNTSNVFENGVLVINGEIKNIKDVDVNVSPIVIKIIPENNKGQSIVFEHSINKPNIPANTSIKFSTPPQRIDYKEFSVELKFKD